MTSIFFSYAHADEKLRDHLEKSLAILKRQGIIDVWYDRCIIPGDPFNDAIRDELERADLILLLVSPDFLASDYCVELEMARAMERHNAGEARVLPVILRPCDWQTLPFGKLLATPTDGRPVTKFPDLDDAFLEVSNAIKIALKGDASKKPPTLRSSPGGGAVVEAVPRSSNLRLKKDFTEADKDRFLEEAFEYMALFFENSVAELGRRNPGIEATFKRIDAHRFSAKVYHNGKTCSQCTIFIDSSGFSRGGGGIAYSIGNWGGGNSFNERLSVEADDQSLFLKPLGMAAHMLGDRKANFTYEGGAEFYWSMLIEPLQR